MLIWGNRGKILFYWSSKMLMAGTLRDLKETVQLRELGRNHDPRSHSFLPVSQPHLLLPTTPSGSDFPQVSTNTEKKQPIFIKRSIILQKKKKCPMVNLATGNLSFHILLFFLRSPEWWQCHICTWADACGVEIVRAKNTFVPWNLLVLCLSWCLKFHHQKTVPKSLKLKAFYLQKTPL